MKQKITLEVEVDDEDAVLEWHIKSKEPISGKNLVWYLMNAIGQMVDKWDDEEG